MLYTLGGNYLDTLPDPKQAHASLGNIRLRIHQDILINTSALVEPLMEGGEILLLPAQTRSVVEVVVVEPAHDSAVVACEKDQRVLFQLQLL